MEGDDRARLDEAAKELERERKREWYRRNAALVSDRHRARYASDPEFRAKRKAMADRYRAAHRDEVLARGWTRPGWPSSCDRTGRTA